MFQEPTSTKQLSLSFLLKETTRAIDGFQIQDWQIKSQTCYPLRHTVPHDRHMLL